MALSQLSWGVFLADLAEYCPCLEESISRCQGNQSSCSSFRTKNVPEKDGRGDTELVPLSWDSSRDKPQEWHFV